MNQHRSIKIKTLSSVVVAITLTLALSAAQATPSTASVDKNTASTADPICPTNGKGSCTKTSNPYCNKNQEPHQKYKCNQEYTNWTHMIPNGCSYQKIGGDC